MSGTCSIKLPLFRFSRMNRLLAARDHCPMSPRSKLRAVLIRRADPDVAKLHNRAVIL